MIAYLILPVAIYRRKNILNFYERINFEKMAQI